jgi:hypothetical protein
MWGDINRGLSAAMNTRGEHTIDMADLNHGRGSGEPASAEHQQPVNPRAGAATALINGGRLACGR